MSSSVSKNGQVKFFVSRSDEPLPPLLNSSSPKRIPNGTKPKTFCHFYFFVQKFIDMHQCIPIVAGGELGALVGLVGTVVLGVASPDPEPIGITKRILVHQDNS